MDGIPVPKAVGSDTTRVTAGLCRPPPRARHDPGPADTGCWPGRDLALVTGEAKGLLQAQASRGVCVIGSASRAPVICCKYAPLLMPLQSGVHNEDPTFDSKPKSNLTQQGQMT